MDDSNVPIFAQAKLEYTKQLVDVLYMNMYDGVRSIYDDSKQLYARKATTTIIYVFRSLLEKVPTWNTEIIDSIIEPIIHKIMYKIYPYVIIFTIGFVCLFILMFFLLLRNLKYKE